MTEAVIARWDGFLAKLQQRHADLMAEAVEGCQMLHLQANLDPSAMTNAWQAIEVRAKNLGSRIDDTWSDKVEEAFEDADASSAVEDRERAKGEALDDHLEVETQRTRVKIFADAARRMMEKARHEQTTEHPCTQCGAALVIPEGTTRALNVTCAQCSSVVTYEPGTWARMIEGFCVHPLVEEAIWDHWIAVRDADNRRRSSRHETLELIQAEETAQINHNLAFFRTRASMFPVFAGDENEYLQGRMRFFYDLLEREKVWTAAGKPRQI